MKLELQRLIDFEELTRDECFHLMMNIAEGKYTDAQVAAMLTAYNMRAITPKELKGFRDALLELSLPLHFGNNDFIDIVGTGGDGKDSFNISTLTAVVVAGAGYKVVKHGNYGVSSICGSSNVLEYLGYKFSNDHSVLSGSLEKYKLVFLHAPLFHPAMKSVSKVRKGLQQRTIFNLLGPLVNPAKPKFQLLGVSNKKILRLYHELKSQDANPFKIVHAVDGYDEVSLTSDFYLADNKGIRWLDTGYFDLDRVSSDAIKGGSTVEGSAKIFNKILENKGTKQQNNVVIANAALAIQTIKDDLDIKECIAIAKASLESGNAHRNFTNLLNQ